MAQGDASASDNLSSAQASDAGAVQQQAGVRMSTEVQQTIGNPVASAGFPETAMTSTAATAGDRVTAAPITVATAGDRVTAAAPTTAALAAPAEQLDRTKTVGQLMTAGVLQPVDATTARKAADAPVQVLKPGESPQVTVTYADAAAGPNQKAPDFIVKQDGSIQASGDPSAANKKDVVIQVERPAGSTANPDVNQQKSIDGLVNYLYGRYATDNPAVAQNGLQLNDQYGLISDRVSQQVAAKTATDDAGTAATRQNFAPQTQGAMSQASRFTPGSSGSMSRGDIGNYVPERSEPRVKDETQTVADIKNAIAAEFRPDAATKENANAPYETVRMDRRGASEVPAIGRYGMTYPVIRGWFAGFGGFDLDSDDEEGFLAHVDAMAKSGKISKKFAAAMHKPGAAHKFLNAMHQMKAGHMPNKADMKELMPAELQEQIAADTVNKFSQMAKGDVGKTALGFHLGKSPDQLTAAELADKGNIEFQRSATTFGQLAHARDTMGTNGSFDYTVAQDGSLLGAKIKRAAIASAERRDTTGQCAGGVSDALAAAGVHVARGDADSLGRNIQNKTDLFATVDRKTAMEAVRHGMPVIVQRQWTAAVASEYSRNIGHIAVLTGVRNGQITEASDHISTYSANNPRYRGNRDQFYVLKADLQKVENTQNA